MCRRLIIITLTNGYVKFSDLSDLFYIILQNYTTNDRFITMVPMLNVDDLCCPCLVLCCDHRITLTFSVVLWSPYYFDV